MSIDINGNFEADDDSTDCLADLPTRTDTSLGITLQRKKAFLTDILNAVRDGDITAAQITGRPGIGKSHLVESILGRDQGHIFCSGVMSRPMAIEKLEQHPDGLFIFDDLAGCPADPVFQQLLLQALEPAAGENGQRKLSYNIKGKAKHFRFTGVFVFVGNEPFRGAPRLVTAALESRVQCVDYSPTREELEWQMYQIAEAGPQGLPLEEAVPVLSFYLRQCRAMGREPDIRQYLKKVLPLYRRCRNGSTACSWQTLVRGIVRSPRALKPVPLSDDDRLTTLQEVHSEFSASAERCAEYCRRTGLSRPTYFRDLQRLMRADELPPPEV